jgi:hypothetical protein
MRVIRQPQWPPPQRRPWDARRIKAWLIVTMIVASLCLAAAAGWYILPRLLERLPLR